MSNLIKRKVGPLIVGLAAAFLIMMVCEFINSFFFPFPEGMDLSDINQIQTFTQSLPWNAYLLVFAGWALGSFAAGYIITKLSFEKTYRLSLIAGVILTIMGILNNIMVGAGAIVNILGLPLFIIFTYLGNRYARNYKR